MASARMIGGKPVVIIEAPSNLGLKPPAPRTEPGVRRMPEALRRAGLYGMLGPSAIMRVEPPPYTPDEARTINVRNERAIRQYSEALASQLVETIRADYFPLVIGGDCSILIGSALGLRRLGSHALLFLDGHTDFYLPEQSATGGAAGMDLALATGWGPQSLTDIDGLRPYFDPRRVIALGNRDAYRRAAAAIPTPADAGMAYFDVPALGAIGIEMAMRQGFARVLAGAPDGLWIHLDVDVLDHDVMPAVDSPQPGGLSYAQVHTAVRMAMETGLVAGMQVTIFDPDLDRDGSIAVTLAQQLATLLGYGSDW